MNNKDKHEKSLQPDSDTVSTAFIPTLPAPVPIPMPSSEKDEKSSTNANTMPKPETTKDNLQYSDK